MTTEPIKSININSLNNSKELLKEFASILTEEKTKDTDCISLYDIANLMKKSKNEYNRIENEYEKHLNSVLKEKQLYIYLSFNYAKKQLIIGVAKEPSNHFYTITLTKQDEELYIVEIETPYFNEILKTIGSDLSKIYDEFMKFSDSNTQKNYNIKPLNSNFLVDINSYGVSTHPETENFELSSHSYTKKYDYKCDSVSVLTALHGKEDEIFKRIFVKIDDCPKWSKQALYQIRQEQLKEEKRLEEEQLYKETKKQKRLELKNKFFPRRFS